MQMQLRTENASKLCDCVWDLLDPEKIESTGALWPRGNLKRLENRKFFAFVHRFPGRVFTERLTRLVVKKLFHRLADAGVHPPRDPNLSDSEWFDRQALKLRRFCRSAKKQVSRFSP